MPIKRALIFLTGGCLLCLVVLHERCSSAGQKKSTPAKTRILLFTYETTVAKLNPNQQARIWLPIPPNTPHQKVQLVFEKLPLGAKTKSTVGKKYGNQFRYIEAKADTAGVIRVQATYRIRREEVRGDKNTSKGEEKVNKLFLLANKNVPVGGKPAEILLKGKNLPDDEFNLGKQFFAIVNEHMKYHKPQGEPWGRGDAVWACDSKFGNCSDFHSLFISLSRTRKMPAKFEMGFPLPDKRGNGEIGGYHCWAWFKPKSHGWVPVDISEANRNPKKAQYFFGNLTENRIAFTTGRDLILNPPQDGPPVNFLVYPYVEVGGKPYENVTRRFLYQDVE